MSTTATALELEHKEASRPLATERPPMGASAPSAAITGTEADCGLHLDVGELAVRVGDDLIRLTRTQFSLLAYLVRNGGRWVTAGELISQVLGTHHRPNTSLVRVHVHAIRRRLGPGAMRLETDQRRARGYRWRVEGDTRELLRPSPIPQRTHATQSTLSA